jgi:acetyltransferase-like isoleucine patch superfamily enzyme
MFEMVRVLLMRARSRGRLVVARSVRVSPGARVHVARGARVLLAPGVALGPDSRIEALGGVVRVGAGAWLGERAVIVAHAGVEIGERARIGDWAALNDSDPTWDDVETPLREQPLRSAAIAVGADAVLGPHASLGPGATVAPGDEVAAYAVVPPPPKPPAKRAASPRPA